MSTSALQAKRVNFTTSEGLSFLGVTNAPLPEFVKFVANQVLARNESASEMEVPIGRAAEIKALADDVQDEIARLVLGLASQDFDAEHKLPLVFESEREQARQIILLAEKRELPGADKQALYDLVARSLIRCGHLPSQILVPEDRLLTPDETLELWVNFRLGTSVEAVDELVARYQAAHNPLVNFLFREWRVIVDLDLLTPMSYAETQTVRKVPSTPPDVKIVFTSNDISQTAEAAAVEPTEQNGHVKSVDATDVATPHGPPRPRISPSVITFFGSEMRCKSSLVLDTIRRRLMGDRRAAGLVPGQHAQVFASRQNGRVERTEKTQAFDFNVGTATNFFAGRANMGITIKDIDGKEFQPTSFGQSQCQLIESADALIIPIDTEAILNGAELRAAQDVLFLSRVIEQNRHRRGLPIAIVIPAADKLIGEAELAAIPDACVFPAEAQRPVLTAVATTATGRLAGGVAERMRHAALQNPEIAKSLRVLRVIDRLFTCYEPLFREAVAITGSIEVFFTMTSTKESGWKRTYGSIEVIQWIASKIESQIRPMLPTLVSRERIQMTNALTRVKELQGRVDLLDARREALRRRRETNATARIIFPWNKLERLQTQDKQSEEAIGVLLAEIENKLGLPQAGATFAARRTAIAAARSELESRISALASV